MERAPRLMLTRSPDTRPPGHVGANNSIQSHPWLVSSSVLTHCALPVRVFCVTRIVFQSSMLFEPVCASLHHKAGQESMPNKILTYVSKWEHFRFRICINYVSNSLCFHRPSSPRLLAFLIFPWSARILISSLRNDSSKIWLPTRNYDIKIP